MERDGRAGEWRLLWRSERDRIIFSLGILVRRVGLKEFTFGLGILKTKTGSAGVKMGSKYSKFKFCSSSNVLVLKGPSE